MLFPQYILNLTHWNKELSENIVSNFTFSHHDFYALCILNLFNGNISVVVCNFFDLGRSQNGVLGYGLKQITIAIENVCVDVWRFEVSEIEIP